MASRGPRSRAVDEPCRKRSMTAGAPRRIGNAGIHRHNHALRRTGIALVRSENCG